MKKVKRLTAVILSALMMTSAFSALPVSAATIESDTSVVSAYETFKSGDYEYSLRNGGTVNITKYVGSDSDVTIPDMIDGKKVMSIGPSAFSDCTTIKSIIIPNGVTGISYYAFKNCTALTDIYIPDSVSYIGWGAFIDCKNLKSIKIPYGVESIEAATFSGCTSLADITVPDTVTSIVRGVLDDTVWYKNQPDGIVYIGKIAYCYKGEMPENTSLEIKQGTKALGLFAFSGCTNLHSITLPNSITKIPTSSFSNCTNLENIIIPNSVTSIEANAFKGCKNLTNVIIPSSVTNIDSYAFSDCTRITNINIPNSVTHIGEHAFNNTDWYNTQPDGIVYINKFAYTYKGDMPENTSIKIKDGTTTICESAFKDCYNLNSVTIPNSVKLIDDYAFCDCSNLNSITIPESVKIIGEYAFCNCWNLNSITIPESIEKVGSYAFSGTSWFENQPDGIVYIGKAVYTYKGEMPENTSLIIKDGTLSICDIFGNSNYDWDNLKSITIPKSVTYIDAYEFGFYNNITIYGYKNSYAEKYANEHNINFIALDDKILTGDANQDGIINVNDVTYLQMHIASSKNTDGSALIDETNKQLFDCVDMNKDGKLSVSDVTALQIYISNNN